MCIPGNTYHTYNCIIGFSKHRRSTDQFLYVTFRLTQSKVREGYEEREVDVLCLYQWEEEGGG